MKQKLLFTLLLLPLWGTGGLFAAAPTATPIAANFTNHTVTLTVTGTAAKTWVWIDYQPVGDAPAFTLGTWGRAPVTVVTSPGTYVAGNTNGFWLMGGATATATLAVTGKFNWCAYASEVPPTAVINAAGGYTLKGTAPFIVNSATLAAGVKTLGAGTCITTLTDYTGNPTSVLPALPTVSTTGVTICYSTAASLTATAGGGTTTAMTYTWNVGGATKTTTVPSNTTAALTTTTTYTVTARNANNCTSAAA
jgi:hypothetical protein